MTPLGIRPLDPSGGSSHAVDVHASMPVLDAVVLVGHGAVPQDCPRDLVQRLKLLEGRRRATGDPPGDEERALDERIRTWPRTDASDPYAAGLERIADGLRHELPGVDVRVAYNEFCAPTLAQAVEALIAAARRRIAVVPSMLTPGGVHSEVEIPAALAALAARHPGVRLRYVWPFHPGRVAALLAAHVRGA